MPPPVSKKMTDNYKKSKETRALQKVEALDLRLSGKSFAEIAQALDVSESSARNYVKHQLEKMTLPEELELLRAEHLARYSSIIKSHWSDAENDVVSADLILKVMRQVENLFGIAAPKRVSVDAKLEHNHISTIDQIDDRLDSILSEIASREIEDAEIVEDEE